MLKINYNKELDEVYIQVYNSIYFNEIQEVFRQYGVSYDKEFKINYCNPKNFLDMRKALSDIEPFRLMKEDEDALKTYLTKPADIKVYRKALHPDNWKYKPLDDYQTDAVKFMVTHEAGIINLPCGSGKTWVYETGIEELLNDNTIEKILIISTRSSLYNWQREILKFSKTLKETDIQIVVNEDNRKVFEIYADKKILITDYDTYKLISEHYTALVDTPKKELKKLKEDNSKKFKKIRISKDIRKTRVDLTPWNPNNKACILLD